ncbi:PCI domain-containing protein [Fusarium pseudoanthophilum]|uniref:PCI domain-containing protein n=1 Tax=Fusarium pseudoanthophilum TaxID=48495 RepID=A0A8H5NNY8_9HYPO|nr:PCI domain-containing protein [Fusarium pseudoanthophilum]
MRSSFALLAMAVSAVSAQTTVQNYKSSLDMTIDPNSVDLATRSSWCGAQQNTCDALCKDDTNENQCTENDLKWECTCSSNSSTPGLQYYTQTMPTFICEELFSQCISQNTGSQSGQKECTSKIKDKCAKQSPPKDVVSDDDDDTSSTATETATTSATRASSEATGTAESVTSTSSDAFAAPTMAPAGRGAAAAVALGMMAYLI